MGDLGVTLQDSLDRSFDAGGKVNAGLTASTIVSQWTWAATLLQSSTVAAKVSPWAKVMSSAMWLKVVVWHVLAS